MKSCFVIVLLTFYTLCGKSQCYDIISNLSGIDVAAYQSELEDAACALRDSFPLEFRDSFKVLEFDFYGINESMVGSYEDVWGKVRSEASQQSPYYLLFGKISRSSGVYTEFWLDLKLPNENIFYCLDQLSPNLRNNLRLKYQAIANEVHEYNDKNPSQYYVAELEVMLRLANYISDLKECCDYQGRSISSCSACVLSKSEYNRILNSNNILALDVERVIDNTNPVMEDEEIGYSIELSGEIIDLDEAINAFKQEILAVFPNATIKVYPCNYTEACSDFDDVLNSFKNDDVDIGLLIGVVGEDGEEGKVRWQMISDDEGQPTPITYSSDTCYYFNSEKMFVYEEYCDNDITPKGILQDIDGYSLNLEFTFSDPELTPRTLTTDFIEDGNLIYYGSTDEPSINKAILMTKQMIFARLAQAIPSQNGSNKPGAFDYHGIAPWSLYQESSGFDAPFDYSTKDFFLDRENFLFITDDGDNIVAHNYRNMGNFLWGAATYIMGVPQFMALAGAHLNNLATENWTFDSPDDQYCIKLGRYYAKKMNWKNTYGYKNYIFRQ